jgi:hypothetical protein
MERKEFIEANGSYAMRYDLTERDFQIVDHYIGLISAMQLSDNEPHVGDLVQGAYYDGMYEYQYGRIDKIVGDKITVCAEGSVSVFDSTKWIGTSISGGPFFTHDRSEFNLVGDDEADFWTFGRVGACAGGGLHFSAPVRRWSIPYTWQSRTFINVYLNKREEGKWPVTIDNTNWSCFIAFGFVSVEQLDRFLAYVGATKTEWDGNDTFKRYKLSHNISELYFSSVAELPVGAKLVRTYCNGSVVDCYINTTEKEIELYRPNPNYKDVYKPYPYEFRRKMEQEIGTVDF